MISIELWLMAVLCGSVLLSLCIWRLLIIALPMLKFPLWRLSMVQALACLSVCWNLGVGPEVGWFGFVLFLLLLQPAITLVLLPLWLLIQRIQRCDPLRERI